MALKTILENLDGVDDAIKSEYTEKDGVFVLNVEGVDSHPEVKNLKSAYERVKSDKSLIADERDSLKSQLSSFPEDFNAEIWEKAKDGKIDDSCMQLRHRNYDKFNSDDAASTQTVKSD